IGETRVEKLEPSSPWPCKMALLSGHGGPRMYGGLLVDATTPVTAPTRTWAPSPSQRATFQALLGDPAAVREALFFAYGGRRFAAGVGAGDTMRIARYDGNAWRVEWTGTGADVKGHHPHVDAYGRLGAIDLDANGAPEIIVEWSAGAAYGDYILRRDDDEHWHIAAESLPGNTTDR
ncbi:MAG TPA: hypothetical protein VIA18_29840, partial [Polyangia bacterium]|nr:hypothetical protein [Polyangia bacterium]